MLDPMKLTGEENVSVVNRVTGKRVGYMFKIPTFENVGNYIFDGFFYHL